MRYKRSAVAKSLATYIRYKKYIFLKFELQFALCFLCFFYAQLDIQLTILVKRFAPNGRVYSVGISSI